MSAARARADAQDGMFDNEVTNDVLEKALERRETMRDRKGSADLNFKLADDEAKQHIAKLELGEPEEGEPIVIRCGRFRIKISRSKAQPVEFERRASGGLNR